MGQRRIGLILSLLLGVGVACAAPLHRDVPTSRHHRAVGHVARRSAAYRSHVSRAARGSRHVVLRRVVVHGRVHWYRRSLVYRPVERFTTSSYADDLTAGDITTGEDLTVRAAAVEALGDMNGTVLAIDPSNGRILTMVNQKLALSAGAEPCSTIKVAVALAALKEGLVKDDTPVNLGGHYSVDLTEALARSVNLYFEVLGRAMGFERVKHYANEFGLGELAGYNIPGEQLGVYPDDPLPDAKGGVGRMCSFGESISMTPLQLGALVSAIANGGTLYYLQHPTTPEEVASFEPKVKRQLDIKDVIPEILPGMRGAVDFSNGTARSLHENFMQFPIFGKTGTCSNEGTRYGWFVSYGEAPTGPIVTVIFLEGGRPTFGPKAAELTGEFYRAMYERNYFAPKPAVTQTAMTAGR
ncbi:MAG TPA: penicillin-binding transpeptidase domain-containing protein [Acidobacteriaceae bacterium]|jgi:cell division protein FtsI/penicillin-binding protein 2|nr:penicillin-binding transpeptidase domain-containing protein [Acidobacteriaceae bacterium]